MVELTGQAGAEITEEMIAAGRGTILRELTHPERDDIGIYKAAQVAHAVFRSMQAIQQHSDERHDFAIKGNEPVGNARDVGGCPSVVGRELKSVFGVPGGDEREACNGATVRESEGDPIYQAMRYAMPVKRECSDLADELIERMFPRLIWVMKEEFNRCLAQAGQPCGSRAVPLTERRHDA